MDSAELYKLMHAHVVANLERLRVAKGWSKNRFVQESGMARSTFFEIETAKEGPQLLTLCRIATAFKISIIELLSEPPPPPPA